MKRSEIKVALKLIEEEIARTKRELDSNDRRIPFDRSKLINYGIVFIFFGIIFGLSAYFTINEKFVYTNGVLLFFSLSFLFVGIFIVKSELRHRKLLKSVRQLSEKIEKMYVELEEN